ncbi:MAG: biotin--[acetyl-CoA-carboxylase] ligase [Acidaminobacteraceae bacterium]
MKRKLLKFLKENKGSFISGEEIASELGVSRTSIWKIINQMKEEGYKIDSAPRKGYKLMLDEDIINDQELNLELADSMYHNKIHYFEEISSTSTYAKEIATKGCEGGTLIISELQVEGRGRLGRNWESPKGSGIWMSLVLKPDLAPTKASKITQIAAAAVVIAVNNIYKLEAKIKWPNDIVINGKKICGILTEMNAELNHINYIVVGIGVNVNTENFPIDLEDKATSIFNITSEKSNRIPLIVEILKIFEELYVKYLEEYDFTEVLEINRKYSATIGRDVVVTRRNDVLKGFAYDLNDEGELLIRKEDEKIETVYYGEVSVRGINGYI